MRERRQPQSRTVESARRCEQMRRPRRHTPRHCRHGFRRWRRLRSAWRMSESAHPPRPRACLRTTTKLTKLTKPSSARCCSSSRQPLQGRVSAGLPVWGLCKDGGLQQPLQGRGRPITHRWPRLRPPPRSRQRPLGSLAWRRDPHRPGRPWCVRRSRPRPTGAPRWRGRPRLPYRRRSSPQSASARRPSETSLPVGQPETAVMAAPQGDRAAWPRAQSGPRAPSPRWADRPMQPSGRC